MEPSRLNEQAWKRLKALLADASLDGERMVGRLRSLGDMEGVPAFSLALRVLAHLELAEDEAELLLTDLVRHRKRVATSLGRDPGLHVAALDYLSNVKELLRSPTVIELSQLEQTERSAVTDPLTSLFNRRHFENGIGTEIRRAKRYSVSLSLLMLDLDFFKSVNDIYGHVVGDRVLRLAGRIMRRCVRESDVACRIGGDEFAVILPETERLGALAVAERIRRRIEVGFSTTPIENRLVAMTVSGGLSSYPEDGTSASALIERADQALYHSKNRGKNGIMIYHPERRGSIRYPVKRSTRAEIASGAAGRMVPVQPVNLSTGGALLEAGPDCRATGAVELTLWEEAESWSIPGRVVRVEPSASTRDDRRLAVAFDEPLPERCLRRSVLYCPQSRTREGSRA